MCVCEVEVGMRSSCAHRRYASVRKAPTSQVVYIFQNSCIRSWVITLEQIQLGQKPFIGSAEFTRRSGHPLCASMVDNQHKRQDALGRKPQKRCELPHDCPARIRISLYYIPHSRVIHIRNTSTQLKTSKLRAFGIPARIRNTRTPLKTSKLRDRLIACSVED